MIPGWQVVHIYAIPNASLHGSRKFPILWLRPFEGPRYGAT